MSLAASLSLFCACSKHDKSAKEPGSDRPLTYAEVPRRDFNHLSLELGLPLFWADDRNGNGKLDPNELDVVWGYGERPRAAFVQADAFTPAFNEAYRQVLAALALKAPVDPSPEGLRRAAITKEISQGYFTLLAADFSGAPLAERGFVQHILSAAKLIDDLFAKQVGSFELGKRLAPDDTHSRLAFFINHGPWCSGPMTEADPNCNALADKPQRLSGLYPAALQQDPAFCDKLAALPAERQLLDPFTVVTADAKGELQAEPYHRVYAVDMQAVAKELDAANAALANGTEAALKAYLAAAAQAFRDNQWFAADEAWAKMNAENSKWYLRIAPDEVYFEPCSRKAGFHLSFARIDDASLAWQRRLDPVKAPMEKALAALAGPPYKARTVSFHLPDFIDIVVNAGDSREPRGATIGQSLPNWGPVANEGRGRTVAMANFYTDPDSRAIQRAQAEALLCKDSMAIYSDEADAIVMGTVLHEAAHNLGPAHEYRVKGKVDDEIFGGPLASTLEELKAQTSALYLVDWLVERKIVARELANKSHLRDLTWAFGHISRGMNDPDGKPKPYSQLAAIQVGSFLAEGAMEWRKEELAANGKDHGCFSITLDKLPAAVAKLEATVLGIKASGDLAAAKELQRRYVEASGDFGAARAAITERYLRFPRASFLYAVRL
jgi:hypothetical protein